MKMSTCMQLCGYDTITGGPELIEEEQKRESDTSTLPEQQNAPQAILDARRPIVVPLEEAWKKWRAE
jgi:hypothetical protein